MRPHHIKSYEPANRFGGMGWVDPKFPSLFFAMDGEVFDLAGKQCLVIGGAYSVDKYSRIARGNMWFEDEQPSQAIKQHVEDKIHQMGGKVNYVFSHTCPEKYTPVEMFLPGIDQSTVDNSTEEWLGRIEDTLLYDRWFCGHFHTDKTIDRIRFIFNDVICLEG